MLRTILVFFDGTAEARKAFDLGLDLAVKYEAQLNVLSVMPSSELEAMLDRKEDYPVKELRELCLDARSKGVQCRYQTDVGDRIEQIVGAASDHRADLIIVGQRSLTKGAKPRTPIERIISNAQCPVTMVK